MRTDLNEIVIDGKKVSKTTQKFYTLEQYGQIKDKIENDSHVFVEKVYRSNTGKFCFEDAFHTFNHIDHIGYAVTDWTINLPKSVKAAMKELEKNPQDEDAAVAYLAAIKKAAKDKNNTLPVYFYPTLYMHGHENSWHTNGGCCGIELTEDYGVKGNGPCYKGLWFKIWGQRGPCSSMETYCYERDIRDNNFKDFTSAAGVIRAGYNSAISGAHNVHGYEPRLNSSMDCFSAKYNREYKPNAKAYEKFCKEYDKEHPVNPINTYTFPAKQVQEGYDSRSGFTARTKIVAYQVCGKTKAEAYEKYKKQVHKHNQRVANSWYPGWEGKPWQEVRPIREGSLTEKGKAGVQFF